MKKLFVSLTAAAAMVGAAAALHAQGAPRSVWTGVYTTVQSDRGKALFMANCSKCHGDNLQGEDEAPQLAGPSFLSNWNGESVGDLVDRIHTSMPADDPGKLSIASATDLAAFILASNQIPAGAAEIPRDTQLQGQLRIDAINPAAK